MQIQHFDSNLKAIIENVVREVVSEIPNREIVHPQYGKKIPVDRNLLNTIEWIGSDDDSEGTISVD